MNENYQAVYDAVRSRISNGDIGSAVRDAIQIANVGHYADMAHHGVIQAACEFMRPSVLYRPALSRDGDQWCALYGEDLMSGIAGFGDTPALAMSAFDKAWAEERSRAALSKARGES